MPLYAGFVGQNVTLPCTSLQPDYNDSMIYVNWHFKCTSCGVEWSPLTEIQIFQSKKVSPDHNVDVLGEAASVSRSSGNLMILNFDADLEGLYMCQYTGHKPYVMELKSAGEFPVQVLEHPQLRTADANYTLDL